MIGLDIYLVHKENLVRLGQKMSTIYSFVYSLRLGQVAINMQWTVSQCYIGGIVLWVVG